MLACLLGLFLFSACAPSGDAGADRLNTLSYAYHYRNLDSVRAFALKALALSDGYPTGKAEAYNNLAFADIAAMDYAKARARLDSVALSADNQLELLVADIQNMRLCQRESRNKDFYDCRERVIRRMKRIDEEAGVMTDRQKARYVYAKTEYRIVCSTYYYYVGLSGLSAEAVAQIEPSSGIQADTAQYAAYLYQIGSGGIVRGKSRSEIWRMEFECLVKCYLLAERSGMVYWQANSLQSISEHLLDADEGYMTAGIKASLTYLDKDGMPDSLLAGYLAQKAQVMFEEYGDVYQAAGAYRTLAQCYFRLGDYRSSLICLENALYNDKSIEKAPSLVESIRECLSIVYSAIGDKNNSDINRNAYLDIQEYTRQDRQLEARADRLDRLSAQLNVLMLVVLALGCAVLTLLLVFNRKGGKKGVANYTESLLAPLREWKEGHAAMIAGLDERLEAAGERLQLKRLQLEKDKRRSLDNKAKVFIVDNVVPYIDRMINEAARLKSGNEAEGVRRERWAYMSELVERISEYNTVLTHWIQLQQGQLSLHIESFGLQEVFSVLAKSGMSFSLKGVVFNVKPTDAVVKADKVMTLFMLNTLADNARKFTPAGGSVVVYAEKADGFVEVSVKDTGQGIAEEELSGIFSRKLRNGHGFGLMNCKGIIDKYKKISQIFSVCGLFAESAKGRGSRFYFRLPYGVVRCLLLLLCVFSGMDAVASADREAWLLHRADEYADSAYYCNIEGRYEETLMFADSARLCLNEYYKAINPGGDCLMSGSDDGMDTPAEIRWFNDGLDTDYDIILDIRNESAVAALALHRWDLYAYNNKIYTRLFKERSADKGLEDYCLTVQAASTNKTTAIVVIVLLVVAVVFVYYFLYYRHVLYLRQCDECVNKVVGVLHSDAADDDKLRLIENLDSSRIPDELKDAMERVNEELRRYVEFGDAKIGAIEAAEDELSRVTYEDEKLYVCNNVIDNSLSALKHETMYYPSRIGHLVDEEVKNIDAVSEVLAYYKDLYTILCEQVRRQVENITFECKPVQLQDWLGVDVCVWGDRTLVAYLFAVLKGQCGCSFSSMIMSPTDSRYVILEFTGGRSEPAGGQGEDLFAPRVNNIPFMVCRQVMREMAEHTNRHGCGVTAERIDGGMLIVRLSFARVESVV